MGTQRVLKAERAGYFSRRKGRGARSFLALFALGMVSLLFTACGGNGGADDSSSEGNGDSQGLACAADGCSVGISVPEAQNPFYVAFADVMKEQLEADGHSVRMVSADSDVPEQIDGIDDLLAAGVDLLLVSPIDEKGPVPAFRAAEREDIPVITYLRTLDPESQADLVKGFIGFYLEDSGKLKGEWLVENLKPGPIAMLLGPAGASFSVEQESGFKTAIEGGGFDVVFEQNSDQTRGAGVQLAEDALTANPDLVAIYASNDDIALGAAQAVSRAGKKGDVAVMGLNGSPPAIEAIEDGSMAMSVALDPVGGGKKVVEFAQKFIETGEIPESTPINQVVVDKKNVSGFGSDG